MISQTPKRKTRSDKFPLTLHSTGQFCKKIKGKLYYFGADKQKALAKYLEQAKWLHAGQDLPRQSAMQGMDLKTLCNLYLEFQEARVNSGEIRLRQLCDQTRLLKRFVKHFGKSCSVADITTIALQRYRSSLVKAGNAASTVNNHISVFKAMFNWAMDNEVVDTVPNLKVIKKSSCSKQPKFIFTADQIKKLIENATPQLKAMIWLGLNCGFGCTDCSDLLWKHLDLDNGRADFARTKTNIGRNLPLWEETVEALNALPRINDRVFNTHHGNKFVRVEVRYKKDVASKIVSYNEISDEFARLLKKAEIAVPKGVGFYTLRRTAATLAAKSGDPFAVQKLLGHADLKMASIYVQDVSEQTDRVINNSRNLIIQDNE